MKIFIVISILLAFFPLLAFSMEPGCADTNTLENENYTSKDEANSKAVLIEEDLLYDSDENDNLLTSDYNSIESTAYSNCLNHCKSIALCVTWCQNHINDFPFPVDVCVQKKDVCPREELQKECEKDCLCEEYSRTKPAKLRLNGSVKIEDYIVAYAFYKGHSKMFNDYYSGCPSTLYKVDYLRVKIQNTNGFSDEKCNNCSSKQASFSYGETGSVDPCLKGYHEARHNGVNFKVNTKTCITD
jgi:hypothetical protein